MTNSFGDVLMPDQAQGAAVISAWMSYGSSGSGSAPTAVTLSPSAVTVQVLNGSGIAGQAQRTASELRASGFNVSGYSTAGSIAGTATIIAYPSGQTALARTVAAHLVGPVTMHADPTLRGSNVVLTTGRGFGGIRAAPPTTAPAASAAPAPAAPPWDPTSC